MSSIPTRALWCGLGLFYLTVQIFNMIHDGNRLKHLTRWSWLLQGLVALALGIFGDKTPVTLVQLTANLAAFVAAAMSVLEFSDPRMLKDYADELGTAMVVVGNILFHYLNCVGWNVYVLKGESKRLREKWKLFKWDWAMRVLVAAPLLATLYGCCFSAAKQYQGHVNFNLLFGIGVLGSGITASAQVIRGWGKLQ